MNELEKLTERHFKHVPKSSLACFEDTQKESSINHAEESIRFAIEELENMRPNISDYEKITNDSKLTNVDKRLLLEFLNDCDKPIKNRIDHLKKMIE